jgi:hypothetical protein
MTKHRLALTPRVLLVTVSLLLAAPLGGCISGTKPAETYTDSNGKTTVIEGDREECTRSCNSDNSRCMDQRAARDTGINGPSGMFGASAECRDNLKSCLDGCKGR